MTCSSIALFKILIGAFENQRLKKKSNVGRTLIWIRPVWMRCVLNHLREDYPEVMAMITSDLHTSIVLIYLESHQLYHIQKNVKENTCK